MTRKLCRLWTWLRTLPIVLAGCTPVRSPAEERSYQECLDAVEAERKEVSRQLCPGDWDACKHRARIMADFDVKQRGCR